MNTCTTPALYLTQDPCICPPGGERYYAGNGISIDGNNVITNTAPGISYTAGDGIAIDGNVIRNIAKGQVYTAGAGIAITNNVISATGGGGGTSYIAGDNIQISGNTISATDTKYTAGTNISISSGNVISATDTKYTAGSGISISGNTISNTAQGKTYTAGSNISISSSNVISATDTKYSAGAGLALSGTTFKTKAPERASITAASGVTVTNATVYKVYFDNYWFCVTMPRFQISGTKTIAGGNNIALGSFPSGSGFQPPTAAGGTGAVVRTGSGTMSSLTFYVIYNGSNIVLYNPSANSQTVNSVFCYYIAAWMA